MRLAFVFPGQGAQRVSMGRDLAERYPERAGQVFAEADDLLGFPLSRLCFDGPAEELQRTEITQPALFVTSVATLRAVAPELPPPAVVAGHSLGEYAAMVAAGVLDWRDGLRLVRRRGELMAGVNARTPGAMAAVIGPDEEAVTAVCVRARAATGEVVEVANHNDDGQHVISGTVAAVSEATRLLSASAGADVRVVPLKVGAPFHSSLMRAIQDEFAADLDAVPFHDPVVPVVVNATATAVRSGAAARAALRAQLASPVLWRQSMLVLAGQGLDATLEIGPGKVLTGIARRMFPGLPTYPVTGARPLATAVAELTGVLVS
ncbi:ACP S-malonyltransferase [Actinomycetes bacterium KLBMP 9797]